MPSKQQKAKKPAGFTIIEVVLVLAIAGLIFLMVFVALPALQRSQRDTQRRSDMARVTTAITNYQANNSGNLPTITGSDIAWNGDDTRSNTNASAYDLGQYLSDSDGSYNFYDPNGKKYQITIKKSWPNGISERLVVTTNSVNNIIYISEQSECASDGNVTKTTGKNYFAVLYKLEGSGIYCLDNK